MPVDCLLRIVGTVRSPLVSLANCPKQGLEGAPEAWIEIRPEYAAAMDGLRKGDQVIVLTWLHEASRDRLTTHPRGNPDAPERGVFSTRSPNRPNPIGLHRVKVMEMDPSGRLRVQPLEVLDGTPVLDIKPLIRGEMEG